MRRRDFGLKVAAIVWCVLLFCAHQAYVKSTGRLPGQINTFKATPPPGGPADGK